MKLLSIITLFITITCHAQITTGITVGYGFKTVEPIISPNVSFAAYGLALSPEMRIHWRPTQPASFGLKISYEHTLFNNVTGQAGYGRYFDLYSTDEYDKGRNGWSNLYFVSVHYSYYFIEYDWQKQSVLSAGVRYTLFDY